MTEKSTIIGFNLGQEDHKNLQKPGHPEHADRVILSLNRLKETGLDQFCELYFEKDDEMLLRKHDAKYVEKLKGTKNYSQEELNEFIEQFDSVFMSKDSLSVANRAVNCCRTLTTKILTENKANGFALVRPPGHHAEEDKACGFCIFNNVAEAAEQALLDGADRVLIVDLDVHHGNGTQNIFYDDDRVLYFSIHRYQLGSFWPHLRESNYDHIGEGKGRAYNVNIPLNETGCSDSDYLATFWNVLWPLAIDFNPNFVIISAGFDSCIGDPLGEMKLTPDGYSHIIYHLKALAGGKMLMVLEGGYNHQVVASAVERCVRILIGATPVPIALQAPKVSTTRSCLNVINLLRNHWPCFKFYKFSAGEAQFAIEIDQDKYSPDDSARSNTGDIDQSSLPKYENPHVPQKMVAFCGCELKPVFLIYCPNGQHFNQINKSHPECVNRVENIKSKFQQLGLESECQMIQAHLEEKNFPFTHWDLEETHERPYLERLERVEKMSKAELRREEENMASIFLTNSSYECALKAAKYVCMTRSLQCLDKVLQCAGPSKGFCSIRPPGHHASLAEANGFCLLNNVAIGVNYVRKKYNLKRVLILDWDVHHGDGTQEIFEQTDEVLFISLHRHDEGIFYPVGANKEHTFVGIGRGKGHSVNIPWSYDYMGDSEYLAAFSKIVMPIAYEYNPELVVISAGFDAAQGDPLGGYMLTPSAYSLMTYMLSSLAGGKIVAVLEGGYNLNSIVNSSLAVVNTMIHRKPIDSINLSELKPPCDMAILTLRNVMAVQSKFWKCCKDFELTMYEEKFPAQPNQSSSSEDEEP